MIGDKNDQSSYNKSDTGIVWGQSTVGTASHVYTDILDNEDDNQQGDEFSKEVTKRLKKYKYRTKG